MKWRFADYLAWQRLGDEVVVIDLRSGTAIGLNNSGALIWSLLPDSDEAAIAAALARQFALDEARAIDDVQQFTGMLLSRGLIVEAA